MIPTPPIIPIAPLDPAALARSLRLPPSALRIVDLSVLPASLRETEAGAWTLRAGALDIPPRLRVKVEVLPSEPGDASGEMDWLVFGPELPRRVEEKIYASPLEYWADRMPEMPVEPALAIPPASPVSAISPPSLRRRLSELDAETWGELRARAGWAGVTPAALLLAALADALAAWSAAVRFTAELQVTGTRGGLWVPLALDGAAPGTFEERARAMQERLRRDLAYPLPGSIRPEGLAPMTVSAALPPKLFREDGAQSDDDATGTFDEPRRRPGSARGSRVREPFLLRFQAAEREGGLLLFWDAAEADLAPGVVDALTGAMRDLLRRLSTGPSWREVRRRLIPAHQVARMVILNTTGSPLPEPYPYELFASRARQQPEAVAVTGHGGRGASDGATYGELLRAANRLAHRLQKAGARRNSPVAVVLEPGPDAVAALFGVLAAGAACLPVDPEWPPDRFRSFLEHGRIELAVTREGLAETLDWPEEIAGVMIEESPAEDLPDGPPVVPSASPKDLAFLLSGPEGAVMLESRGVANLAVDLASRFGIGPGDRTLALSPLTEGAALFEILATLSAGGTLVVPSTKPAAGISVLAVTPDRVEARLAVLPGPPRVLLVIGGPLPALPAGLAESLRRAGTRVAELRGSLETSVWTAVHEGTEEPGSFGQPLSNQTVHVLDGRMELRPFWMEGDLYLGGIGLARGYWRDSARSAARFVIHPDTGERLFRTGLRARWVPEGRIELV